VRLVGPSTPITKRGLSGRRASIASQHPRQARALAIEFVDQVLEAVVGLLTAGGIEGVGLDQVRAGFQVGVWMSAMMSGRVSSSRSLLPRWS
jgi:hypothetical protein